MQIPRTVHGALFAAITIISLPFNQPTETTDIEIFLHVTTLNMKQGNCEE